MAELIASRRTATATETEARRRAEQRRALMEAESGRRLLENVLRHLPVGAVIAEAPTGRLLLGNAAMESIWRMPFAEGTEIAGYGGYSGFRPGDRSPYAAEDWPLARSIAAGETVERERIDILRGDGTYGSIEVSSSPVRSEGGEIVAAVVLFDDVTERERAERSLRLLAQTGDLLDAAADPGETIERIAALMVPALGDICAAYLLDDDGAARRVAVASSDPGLDDLVRDMRRRGPVDAGADDSLIVRVIREDRSALVPEPALEGLGELAEDPEQAALLRRLGAGATAVVPLRARGEALGALLLGAFGERRQLAADDLPLIEDVARRAAFALEAARAHSHDRATAELLQVSLLPKRLPVLEGAEVTARYVASGRGEHVGGDWYDVIELPDGRTGLVIGDVAGHGVRAASAMGRVRSALRAFALEGASPGEVLTRLNEFERRLGEGEMVTLFYAIQDQADRTLTYAAAGHPHPLLVTADGTARRLPEARSVPIGVRAKRRFAEAVEPFSPGDTLVLYTDGLVERRDASLDAGLQRLSAAARLPASGVDGLCQNILDATIGSERPEDDVALLVFRVLALPAERFNLRMPADPASLSLLRRRLRSWLGATTGDPSEVEEIVLACGEACANAIEHAYGPADAMLDVEGTVEESCVEIAVADSGRWRETRSEDRGLGLTIIEALMDEVAIETREDGTRVRMRRTLGIRAHS